MSKDPLVTIIMSTLNHGKYISRSIKRTLDQSFQDFEFIIVNDGSTDNTEEIVKSFKDERIIYLKNETNKGVPYSFNKAMKIAKGKYIARVDSDDAWIGKDKLKKQVEFLEKNKDYAVTGGGMVVVKPNGQELFRYLKPETDKETRKNALTTNPVANSTSVCRKDAVVAIGLCNEKLPYNEDWDFWLNIGKQGKFYNFQEYFSYYTFTGTNKSMRYLTRHTWTAIKVIWKHRKDYPGIAKGLFINFLQLCYSFIPFFIRKRINPFFSKLKKSLAGAGEEAPL